MKQIKIFDTTLRDGEQSPGASLSVEQKVAIAKQLERLNIDVIEAGFPIASKDSFTAVQLIAQQVHKPVICGLARTMEKDITTAWEAVKDAQKPRIHTFIATSSIHRDHKLKKSADQVKEMAVKGVKLAKSFCDDVEFSPEDAARTDLDYMCQVIEAAVSAGATTINIPDTVGYATPTEFGSRFTYIQENIKNIKGITLSAHCHDDLGLAVANSLVAIENGATQIEGCVNGIGERAGNTAIEEVIMALKTRSDFYNADTGINTKEIFNTSQLISKLTGMDVQKNKAIVGRNAFAHESGIHQHGVIANKNTYEIMNAESVGWQGENITIGKLSGKHAIEQTLQSAGIDLTPDQLVDLTQKVKDLGDKQKQVERDDILALAYDLTSMGKKEQDLVTLDEVTITTGNKVTPTSTMTLLVEGQRKQATAKGVGPVDASTKALSKIVGPFINLKEYNLKAITGGTDALANVSIKFQDKQNNVFGSQAVDEDVILASIKAMVKGVNKAMIHHKGDRH